MHTHTYIQTDICSATMRASISGRHAQLICICMYAFMYTHVFAYVYVYVCECVCVHVYVCMRVCSSYILLSKSHKCIHTRIKTCPEQANNVENYTLVHGAVLRENDVPDQTYTVHLCVYASPYPRRRDWSTLVWTCLYLLCIYCVFIVYLL